MLPNETKLHTVLYWNIRIISTYKLRLGTLTTYSFVEVAAYVYTHRKMEEKPNLVVMLAMLHTWYVTDDKLKGQNI